MAFSYHALAYFVPLAILWVAYARVRSRNESRAAAVHAASLTDGLGDPPSLHPLIDIDKCLGCGACTRACPEGQVLGLIDGKARLIEGANCIGHGACKAACPFDAITLVFGTEKRGVDIPEVGPDFQTNVPGIFIAGELGGMGLIRNATQQGQQAIAGVIDRASQIKHPDLDLIIVGAGPAGLAAGLAAKVAGIRFGIIEQETFGGTVAHFPRGKIVMTQPMNLPLVGKLRFREVSKEQLLGFWAAMLRQHPLPIAYGERVEKISSTSNGFELATTRSIRNAASVLLAIGRRGTPRKLDVPGEDLTKVVYRLADPAQYQGLNVLVVGGGDSALEAAADISEASNAIVTLSYRGPSFARAKSKNRKRIEAATQSGKVNLRLGSTVVAIGADVVQLHTAEGQETLLNDAVIVCAGGVLPTAFLKSVGIRMETKHGTE